MLSPDNLALLITNALASRPSAVAQQGAACTGSAPGAYLALVKMA